MFQFRWYQKFIKIHNFGVDKLRQFSVFSILNENFPVFPEVSMIEPVDKRERRLQHLCRKKRNNGFTWMADQISVERKKKTNFFLYWGPRKSRGQSGKRKSDLKRYFTTDVFNDFYKVMSSILKFHRTKRPESEIQKRTSTVRRYDSYHIYMTFCPLNAILSVRWGFS